MKNALIKLLLLLLAIPIAIFIIIVVFPIFFMEDKVDDPYKYVKNSIINVDVNECENIYNEYVGLRDGYAFMSFDCNGVDISNQLDYWSTLPLTKKIDNSIYYIYDKYNFNRVKTGKSYFIDRDPGYDQNVYSDFALGIYDSENKMFYFYEYYS